MGNSILQEIENGYLKARACICPSFRFMELGESLVLLQCLGVREWSGLYDNARLDAFV